MKKIEKLAPGHYASTVLIVEKINELIDAHNSSQPKERCGTCDDNPHLNCSTCGKKAIGNNVGEMTSGEYRSRHKCPYFIDDCPMDRPKEEVKHQPILTEVEKILEEYRKALGDIRTHYFERDHNHEFVDTCDMYKQFYKLRKKINQLKQ